MSRRPDGRTFADIVREVESTPQPEPQPPSRPGLYPDAVVDVQGRQYQLVDGDVSEGRALDVVRAGATVVSDPCGCGGHCGMEWYTDEEVRSMVASGPPSISRTRRKQGRIMEWRSTDGAALLVVENRVTWGDVIG